MGLGTAGVTFSRRGQDGLPGKGSWGRRAGGEGGAMGTCGAGASREGGAAVQGPWGGKLLGGLKEVRRRRRGPGLGGSAQGQGR